MVPKEKGPPPGWKEKAVARDLFMLCRRASYAISKGRPEDAAEILSHAVRIAEKIGVKEQVVRAV